MHPIFYNFLRLHSIRNNVAVQLIHNFFSFILCRFVPTTFDFYEWYSLFHVFFLLILHELVASEKRICKWADVDPYFMCRLRYVLDGVGDGGCTIRCAWTPFKKKEEKKKTSSVCETGFQIFYAFLMKLILFGRLHSAHVSTAYIWSLS